MVIASPPASDPTAWNERRWYALSTKSRHEKLVHEELQKKKIESFLPLRNLARRWSDRLKRIEEPLFKGYLFVRIPLKDRLEVLKTRGSVRFVSFQNRPVPVPERDLEAVRRFLKEKIAIDPFPYLAEGDRVFVRSGVLKGVEGFIVRKEKHSRLIVSLAALAQSVSVAIDGALVEKI